MDWGKSYTAEWRVFKVNRKTWADGESVANVDNFSVTRTADGSMLESGSIDVSGDFEPDYYRLVMIAEQGGEVQRVDVATLLFDFSNGRYSKRSYVNSYDGSSVLSPASTTSITTGAYAPKGVDGAKYVKELLSSAINAPVHADGSFVLNDNIVFELGAAVLDCAWLVLNAGDFVMQIDGHGEVHIQPMPKSPSLIINTVTSEILGDEVGFSSNIRDIPNRYIVIDGNIVTVAINDDENSPVSTVNRGYNVDLIDTSPALVNSETYADYANRMLEKSSILKEDKDYTREYAPDVYPYSIVRSSIEALDGDLRVQSQTFNCGNGVTVAEKASKETKLWSK